MKIEYDRTSDSKYIRLKEGEIVNTVEKADWLFYDLGKNGGVLGVEIHNASNHPVSVAMVNGDLFCVEEVVYTSTTEETTGPSNMNIQLDCLINPGQFNRVSVTK